MAKIQFSILIISQLICYRAYAGSFGTQLDVDQLMPDPIVENPLNFNLSLISSGASRGPIVCPTLNLSLGQEVPESVTHDLNAESGYSVPTYHTTQFWDGTAGDEFNTDECSFESRPDENRDIISDNNVEEGLEEYIDQDTSEANSCDYISMLKDNFPRNAGYAFPFPSEGIEPLCNQLKNVADGNYPGPHLSNCATSTFMAIQIKLQMHYKDEFEEQKDSYSCSGSSGFGPSYSAFVQGIIPWAKEHLQKFDPDADIEDFLKTLPPGSDENWPSPGDPMVMDRHSGTGHAVVFTRYKDNNTKVCYFSSNSSTDGFGGPDPDRERCEDISKIKAFTVVKIPLQQEES